jgi:twitching motility protein PilJ
MMYRGRPVTTSSNAGGVREVDLMAKILQANTLEQAGDVAQAAQLYQEVIRLDQDGTYAAIAEKALAALPTAGALVIADTPSAGETAVMDAEMTVPQESPWRWLHQRSVGWKFGLLVVVQVLTIAAWLPPAMTPPVAPTPTVTQTRTSQMTFATLLLLLNGLVLWWFWRDVVVPLRRLTGDEPADEVANEVERLTQAVAHWQQKAQQAEQTLAERSQAQEAELARQRQDKDRLQQEVIHLLLEIEGAQRGDLTVQAPMTPGEVGSIADAFNATIASLRQLVLQVQGVAHQVQQVAQAGAESITHLTQAAQTQSEQVQASLETVAAMNRSIAQVTELAQQAAQMAHAARVAAQAGDGKINQTVASIEGLRATVAATAKKVKRLAEASQEISQIVGIISAISEKTNLLAFNASIEATRAGEHGQGFRVVADEVRRLAQQVTEATREIEQRVTNIQEGTGDVIQAMETGTSEVVASTQLVQSTRETFQGLAQLSQDMDQLLQEIARQTHAQREASQEVNQRMGAVNAIAAQTAAESQTVTHSLEDLLTVVADLQTSVARFRVNP